MNSKRNKKNKNSTDLSPVKKSIKAIAYLKRVGGDKDNLSQLTEHSLIELLNSCNKRWCDKDYTLVFPLFPEPKYVGPIGLHEVAEETDDRKAGYVRGDRNELKVLRTFEDVSLSKKLGLKLFSGIKFNKSSLELLASVLSVDFPASDFPNVEELETDLICIYSGAICLVEIKSTSTSETLWVSTSFRFIGFFFYLSGRVFTFFK
jgi:hypothetical protein